MKNIYILRKEQNKRKYYLQMAGNIVCRTVTVAAGIVAFVAIAGEGPSVIVRRLTVLACAIVLIFIATWIEKRIYMELPLDKYFEEK